MNAPAKSEMESARKLRRIRDTEIRHVYPTFGRDHVTDKRDQCWCAPRIEFVSGGAIIIHEAEQ